MSNKKKLKPRRPQISDEMWITMYRNMPKHFREKEITRLESMNLNRFGRKKLRLMREVHRVTTPMA